MVQIISALIIILFLYTGLNKLLDYDEFKFQLNRSPFLQSMSGFLAALLPAGEILIAISLTLRKTRLLGLYLSFFLMAAFTAYIWIMLYYAYDLPCSCGGILSAMSWHDHLVFNAFFTVLTIVGVVLQSKLNTSIYIRGKTAL